MVLRVQIYLSFLACLALQSDIVVSQHYAARDSLQASNDAIGKTESVPISDKIFAPDKAQHFMGSMISTLFLANIFEGPLTLDPSSSRTYSVSITFGLGLTKEIADHYRSSGVFSWKDLLADAAGIAVGLVLINQP